MRDRFFIDSLVPELLGTTAEVTTATARFVSSEVLGSVDEVREVFHDSRALPHVALGGALMPRAAKDIAAALRRARFRRHHHRAYRVDVSPLDGLPASALRRFCRWLASADAARFHGWLTAWPPDGTVLEPHQVQVARAKFGDEFPLHVDQDEEGLSVVYNFSEGFDANDGGVLYFPKSRSRPGLAVPPWFNSVFLFRSRGAAHGVSRVRTPTRTRYSVTAFYAVGPP